MLRSPEPMEPVAPQPPPQSEASLGTAGASETPSASDVCTVIALPQNPLEIPGAPPDHRIESSTDYHERLGCKSLALAGLCQPLATCTGSLCHRPRPHLLANGQSVVQRNDRQI